MRQLALLTLAALPALCQAPDGRFAGTWQAKVKDSVICTIDIHVNGKITGSIHDCRIQVDHDGNLQEPDEPAPHGDPTPIAKPRVDGDTLTFETKDETDPDWTTLEFRLKSNVAADLTIPHAPMKINPIRFTRTPKA